MIIWLQLKRWIKANIFVLNGKNLLFTFLGYIVLSWSMLYLAGETDLTSSVTVFAYYLVVTASTVGLMLLKFCGCRRMLERKWSKTLPKRLSPYSRVWKNQQNKTEKRVHFVDVNF